MANLLTLSENLAEPSKRDFNLRELGITLLCVMASSLLDLDFYDLREAQSNRNFSDPSFDGKLFAVK